MAYVVAGAGDVSSVTVQYMTQAEFTASTLVFCAPTAAGKTVNGAVSGAGLTDVSMVSMGGASATVLTFIPPFDFQLTGVPDGAQDLVAYRHSLIGDPDAAIIRRDQDIADNGTIATLDFGAAEAFTPTTATITLAGLAVDETVFQGMFYQVGANCATATLYTSGDGGETFTASGIPSGQQRVTDFHGVNVVTSAGDTAFRFITQYNHTLAARTVTLGAAMPAPTITDLGGPYKRLQAGYTLPTDYEGLTSFDYSDGANKSVNISATFGYLGGASTTLALADFSSLSGWDNTWAPASSSTGDWTVSGAGTLPGSVCVENASFKAASVSGTF